MVEHTPVPQPKWRDAVWLCLLVATVAFVVVDSVARSRHLLNLSATYGETVDAPELQPGSLTGYASGRRSMLLTGSVSDTHHWTMQTQQMLATGAWRIRDVDYDNAPEGREVHWASPIRWWLGALAWIDHAVSGRPLGSGVERAALVGGPLMFGCITIGLILFLRRADCSVPVALVLVSCVAVPAFYLDYLPGRMDHHGLANVCAAATVWMLWLASRGGEMAKVGAGSLPAVAVREGRVPAGVSEVGRRWIIGSAVAGGAGLWISASTQIPVLIGAGLGIVAAGWFGRKEPEKNPWLAQPQLLRIWGWTGAAVSLAAYLIEYAPADFGLRLEVNHPLYGLAWGGAGELLRLYARGLRGGWCNVARRDWTIGALAVCAISAVPLTMALGGTRVFLVNDALLWRISTRHISEAQSLAQFLLSWKTWVARLAMVLPAAWLILPALVGWRATLPRHEKSLLLLATVPAVVGWVLAAGQIRWLGLAWALTLPQLAAFFRVLCRRFEYQPRAYQIWTAVAALLFAPGIIHAVRQSLRGDEVSPEEIRQLAERDIAHWLRLRTVGEPTVVAAAPGATTWLIAYGGLRGVGTLYWENVSGLRKIGELFAAPDAETARALAQRFGITHIVCTSWSAFESVLVRETLHVTGSTTKPADAFISRLLTSPVPVPWLRAIPFRLPPHEMLAGAEARIWEVVPDQAPADALAHATNYFLELGQGDAVQRLAPGLAQHPNSLNAAVMLAAAASQARDEGAFLSAMQRVIALLPQASALPLDDHVHLVVVLAVAQRTDLAREHLQACMRKVTAVGLRRLTPGTLSDLLALADDLAVEFPDPETQRLAASLLPASRRN